ncbi:helix-turn-helix domain-containing protein [Streptomyces sp. SID3343]|uniref:GlxA family transcriptional regulator n=1 Tax=Streptomyces sp. SID3343 TaxID=2690260 RepID=UPI0013698170|nr:helix-turn-helix domain-containing protein [Streptomyces sp. SID3343]MYV97971.1 helix-turn-helix domain-containing protein [Streptomyces sp. SID3343]
MLRNVVVIAQDNVAPFELGVLSEVFGIDRSEEGCPVYDFTVCAVTPGRVRTKAGYDLYIEQGLESAARADLIAIPAAAEHDRDTSPDDAVLDVLRAAEARGAWIVSVCTGAFTLAHAGLLDDRRCTTHWKHTDQLARLFPAAVVEPDVLYVEDRRVITSAGTAAGIDACLHLVRLEDGTRVANAIARRMVVPPHREGGQSQYIARPLPEPSTHPMRASLTWMEQRLATDLTVDQMAEHAHMSARSFARRFQQETGTTPYEWLTTQRVLLARELLEETDLPVDVVAERSGFGSAATLRHHFLRRRGTTPQNYRRTFCPTPATA